MSALRIARLGLIALLSFLLEACGSSGSNAGSSGTHRNVAVSISGYKFTPAILTVSTGDTIVWTNRDADNHTATAGSGAPVTFDSSTLAKGSSFRTPLTKAGTYHYHCAFHPFMTGTVTVSR